MFRKKTIILIFLFILILPAAWSLFRPGFFPSDDGEWMVIRLTDFHRSFVSGQIPVRWAARLNHSYGYPVFNFLYPLSLYWGEFFHLIGFSFVWSIKLVFIFSFFLSGFLMYLFGCKLWGKWGGLISAVFYVYAPYRFLDIYVRGSLGEAVAFIFPPLIFLSLFFLSKKTSFFWLVIGGFSLAALIMSHNIMAMLFMPLILIYAGLLAWTTKKKKMVLIYFFGFFLLGLGLSCFFWLPALYDKKFIVLDQIKVANYWEHFPSLKQLIVPSWGYGPSVVGIHDNPSYQIGLFHLLAVVFSFIFLFKSQDKEKKLQVLFFALVFLIAFFLMLSVSQSFWRIVPLLWWTQFPWRLLALTTFSSSILAGVSGCLVKSNLRNWPVALLSVLVIAVNFRYARPESFVVRPEEFYTSNEATTTVKDEYMPVWVKEKPKSRPGQKVEVISGKGKIENLNYNSKKISFAVFAEEEIKLQINTIYFPGWYLKVDNQPLAKFEINNPKGVIDFVIPPGSHQVSACFGETEARTVADLISLGSLIIAGGLLTKGWRRKNEV